MEGILWALILGFGFGWALQKGGLTQYATISNVFRFKDLTVLKFMMTGLCVGMVGVYGLNWLGVLEMTKVNETYLAGNLIGGIIFGVGMAVAGF
ncbi:YeeE/YedE thiosulfate transporter family protein [Zhaonella formicivorans]|uniref:YeeE/YedE thiosulfate transporter family protein n=1 Tax=Zhaonella formicivorans TaxID=2528593 RepID=UPI0010EC4B0A|nr:YeeE/YedE thiosulfate transporter family protein [Zhaonella formicivorans]